MKNENLAANTPYHATAVVVSGLGYPNGRPAASPEPTGWIRLPSSSVSHIDLDAKVSRETFQQ